MCLGTSNFLSEVVHERTEPQHKREKKNYVSKQDFREQIYIYIQKMFRQGTILLQNDKAYESALKWKVYSLEGLLDEISVQ